MDGPCRQLGRASGATTCSNPLANLTLYQQRLSGLPFIQPKTVKRVSIYSTATPPWSLLSHLFNSTTSTPFWTTDNRPSRGLCSTSFGEARTGVQRNGRVEWKECGSAKVAQVTCPGIPSRSCLVGATRTFSFGRRRKHRVHVCASLWSKTPHPADQQAQHAVSLGRIPLLRSISNETRVAQLVFALR